MIFKDKPTHKEFINIEGKQFNRWLVLGYAGAMGTHQGWWCECQCTNKTLKILHSTALRSGNSKSCGCYRNEKSSERFTTHGKVGSPEYRTYTRAKGRCENYNSPDYKDYGDRGIEFRFSSFEEFYSVLGDKPEPKNKYSINRIDNNGHYEKGNVKWSLPDEQARNTRQNHWITYKGQIKCLSDWAEEYNINIGTLCHRLILGWCIDCSLNIKVKSGVCQHKNEQ